MLSLRIKCTFFWLQKFFNREFVSERIFSKFLLSLLITMFEKLSAISGDVFLTLLTIFLMLLRRLTLLIVRSFVPTWTINHFGFHSSTSSILSTMSPLVAHVIFKISTFFDLDNPLPLILFDIESPIITTFFDFLLHISTVTSLTLLQLLI